MKGGGGGGASCGERYEGEWQKMTTAFSQRSVAAAAAKNKNTKFTARTSVSTKRRKHDALPLPASSCTSCNRRGRTATEAKRRQELLQ